MDSMTSREERSKKLEALFPEMFSRLSNNESGELHISWKGSSVAIKFAQWVVRSETLTSDHSS